MYLFQTIVSIDDKLEQMRLELRTELGDFEVFDLNGLVRLALPRNVLPSEKKKASYDSQVYVSSYRVHKLSDFIYTKNMRIYLKSAIEYIRTLPIGDSNYSKNIRELADKGEIALKHWNSFEKNQIL
ncbi:unnamed protein product [Rhizophagus irregularis]|nr:unnamed protein product [Rhizophagus irregularis]